MGGGGAGGGGWKLFQKLIIGSKMLSYTQGSQVFSNDVQLYGYKFKCHAEFFSFLMRFLNEFPADLYAFSSWFRAVVN